PVSKGWFHSKAEGSARMPQSRRGQQGHCSPPRDPGRHHQGPRPTYHAQTRRRQSHAGGDCVCRQHWRGTRSLSVLGAKQLRDRRIERLVERVTNRGRQSSNRACMRYPSYLISCSQSSPAGALSTTRLSCGLIHFGGPEAFPTEPLQHIRQCPGRPVSLPAALKNG